MDKKEFRRIRNAIEDARREGKEEEYFPTGSFLLQLLVEVAEATECRNRLIDAEKDLREILFTDGLAESGPYRVAEDPAAQFSIPAGNNGEKEIITPKMISEGIAVWYSHEYWNEHGGILFSEDAIRRLREGVRREKAFPGRDQDSLVPFEEE